MKCFIKNQWNRKDTEELPESSCLWLNCTEWQECVTDLQISIWHLVGGAHWECHVVLVALPVFFFFLKPWCDASLLISCCQVSITLGSGCLSFFFVYFSGIFISFCFHRQLQIFLTRFAFSSTKWRLAVWGKACTKRFPLFDLQGSVGVRGLCCATNLTLIAACHQDPII